MGLLESIRKWIDGESGEDLLEAADEQSRPRRVWEEFLVRVAREVEAVMQQEMFTPPGGPTYIPREYIVYLTTEDEQTVVRPRVTTLFSMELWRNGVREVVVPVTKSEITIGRGSRTISVDLPIKGDPEVSRVHATLTLDGDGSYWLVAKGRNPTLLNGEEIPRGERIAVAPDERISICSFVLRIQPK